MSPPAENNDPKTNSQRAGLRPLAHLAKQDLLSASREGSDVMRSWSDCLGASVSLQVGFGEEMGTS